MDVSRARCSARSAGLVSSPPCTLSERRLGGVLNDSRPENERKFNVAYIPVTCHLACPVTDYISKFSAAGEVFLPTMFQGFPEIKEALIAERMQAGFIVAPMAIALRSQGVPIKIVYLGHRYGSAVVVQKDGPVKTFPDLRGSTVAIPSRFSDERLIVFRAMKVNGIKPGDVKMVEMAPPDVAGALAAKAIDAFLMGEPFPSQAEMGGFGRVLFRAREYWPDYMSCVLVVREDVIDRRPEAVQVLVDGIARSGLWLDEGQKHRENAAEFVGRFYFNQQAGVVDVGADQADRSGDVHAAGAEKARLRHGARSDDRDGVLDKKIEFEEYTDLRFSDHASIQTSWKYEPGSSTAE